jgi:hypothetical protein
VKVSRRDFERNLPSKGFEREAQRDHVYLHHKYNGRRTGAYTKLSHSLKMREVSGPLLTTIRLQLQLQRTREAVDLLECPMDGDTYNQLLIERGIIKPSE